MARKGLDGSAPQKDKEAAREREREQEGRRERREGGESQGRKIVCHSVQSKMMSAANEFPSRVLLPWGEEKQNAPLWAACTSSQPTGAVFLLNQLPLHWPEGRSTGNIKSTLGHSASNLSAELSVVHPDRPES